MPSNRLSTSFSSASRRLTLYSVRSDWVSRSRIGRSISLRKGANLPPSPAFSFSRKTACRMVASWIAWFAAIWCVLVVQAQAVALLLQFAVDLQVSALWRDQAQLTQVGPKVSLRESAVLPQADQGGDHLRISRQFNKLLIHLVGNLLVSDAHVGATPHDCPGVSLAYVCHAAGQHRSGGRLITTRLRSGLGGN